MNASPADPEQVLVEALAEAVGLCRAAGREHAARVAWAALGELLAPTVQPTEWASDQQSSAPLLQLQREK